MLQRKPAKYYSIVWQKNPDFQAAIKFSATKKPAKYYPIVWQKNPDFQANPIAITCCSQLWCYKKTCKILLYRMAKKSRVSG